MILALPLFPLPSLLELTVLKAWWLRKNVRTRAGATWRPAVEVMRSEGGP